MTDVLHRAATTGVALLCVAFVPSQGAAQGGQMGEWTRLPPQFVANGGQWHGGARFCLAHGATRTWIADDSLYLQAEGEDIGACVRLQWEQCSGRPEGIDLLPTRRHWLRSEEQGGAVADVSAFARVVQRELHPSIDLVLRCDGGRVAYDFVCRPGADLSALRVRAHGHDAMRLDADGTLVLDTALGELRQTPPRTWTTLADGSRAPLPSRFRLLGPNHFAIQVDGWSSGELTIDPNLEWGSFLGGAGLDRCTQVAVDSAGATIVAGTTNSADFPTVVGSYRLTPVGGNDAFVAKIAVGGGALVFCTYLGGSADDNATALQVLSSDRIAIGGVTASVNFPLTGNRYQPVNSGNTDAFVVILPVGGNTLEYASYYGGTGFDSDVRMWVEGNGDVWLAGRATGSTPITANAIQSICNGAADVFLGIINRSIGTNPPLRYGTLYGGSGDERNVGSLHVTNGIATIACSTDSADTPLSASPFQAAPVGVLPTGFLLRLDPAQAIPAQTLVYASYFGATGGSTDWLRADVDSAGLMLVTATTSANTWPTTPVSYQQNYGGGASDGIVCRFNPTVAGPSALLLCSYIGGNGADAIEDHDFVYVPGSVDFTTVVGSTSSTNFPVTAAAVQSAFAGTGTAGMMAQLDFRLPSFLQLRYSTLFDGAGAGNEVLRSVYRDSANVLTVAGESSAVVVPGTPYSFQTESGGGTEGIVARLDTAALPAPFATFGVGCGLPGFVPAVAGVTAARIGSAFAVNVTSLRPNGGGLMLLGLSNIDWLGAPLPLELSWFDMPGCNLNVSLDESYFVLYSGTSMPFGLTIPPSMQFYGIDIHLQFAMLDVLANVRGVAVSNGIKLNVRY